MPDDDYSRTMTALMVGEDAGSIMDTCISSTIERDGKQEVSFSFFENKICAAFSLGEIPD